MSVSESVIVVVCQVSSSLIWVSVSQWLLLYVKWAVVWYECQ